MLIKNATNKKENWFSDVPSSKLYTQFGHNNTKFAHDTIIFLYSAPKTLAFNMAIFAHGTNIE